MNLRSSHGSLLYSAGMSNTCNTTDMLQNLTLAIVRLREVAVVGMTTLGEARQYSMPLSSSQRSIATSSSRFLYFECVKLLPRYYKTLDTFYEDVPCSSGKSCFGRSIDNGVLRTVMKSGTVYVEFPWNPLVKSPHLVGLPELAKRHDLLRTNRARSE